MSNHCKSFFKNDTTYLGNTFRCLRITLPSEQEQFPQTTLNRVVRCIIIITHKFGWERYASQGSRRDSPLQLSRVQFGRKDVARKQ